MNIKDDVICVYPNGFAVPKTAYERAEKFGREVITMVEASAKVLVSFVKNAWNGLMGIVKRLLKKQTKRSIEKQESMDIRKSWTVPMKMTVGDQVMNRRPAFPRIRSHI